MKRFRKMSEYFDAYRIDHILGFFRIWEIPMDAVHGLLGQFVPALPMTREEIESYGLHFRRDFFLKPYIHEYFLGQMFGPHTDYVKQTFIEPTDTWEVYRMRPEFDTQRKVEAYFAGRPMPTVSGYATDFMPSSAMSCLSPTVMIPTSITPVSAYSTTTSTVH